MLKSLVVAFTVANAQMESAPEAVTVVASTMSAPTPAMVQMGVPMQMGVPNRNFANGPARNGQMVYPNRPAGGQMVYPNRPMAASPVRVAVTPPAPAVAAPVSSTEEQESNAELELAHQKVEGQQLITTSRTLDLASALGFADTNVDDINLANLMRIKGNQINVDRQSTIIDNMESENPTTKTELQNLELAYLSRKWHMSEREAQLMSAAELPFGSIFRSVKAQTSSKMSDIYAEQARQAVIDDPTEVTTQNSEWADRYAAADGLDATAITMGALPQWKDILNLDGKDTFSKYANLLSYAANSQFTGVYSEQYEDKRAKYEAAPSRESFIAMEIARLWTERSKKFEHYYLFNNFLTEDEVDNFANDDTKTLIDNGVLMAADQLKLQIFNLQLEGAVRRRPVNARPFVSTKPSTGLLG